MNRTLIILVLAVIVLAWNFVFTDKQVGLTDQARVLQGLSQALEYKTAVVEYWSRDGTLPDAAEWARSSPTINVDLSQTIVAAIAVGTDGPGVISVHFIARPGLQAPERIGGKKINLIPAMIDYKIEWTCKGNLESDLLPRNCTPL